MELQIEQTVWLTSPDELKEIDFNDPVSIESHTSLTSPRYQMEAQGWVKLGMATISYGELAKRNAITVAAAAQIDKAIEGLRAETEVKINEFLRVQQELLCLEAPAND